MDRDELFRIAESCIGPPPESVVIATEEKANNFYTFWKDSEGKIWYTSERTERFDAEMQEAAKRRKAEKRKTSDATREEASEEPVMLTDHYKESIA